MSVATLRHYRIAPSDLVFLWEECKRCLYLAYNHGIHRPRSFSPHFTNADRAMRRALSEHDTIDLGVGPRFKILELAQWVESEPISFEKHGVSLSFYGQYDAVVVTEHDEIVVVDFKTTTLDDGALMKYRRALMCYVTAIELPKSETTTLPAYVDGMALMVFDPANFAINPKTKRSGLYGRTRWVELPRRNDLFDRFLNRVASLLADPELPPQSPNCEICKLRLKK